MKKHFLTKGFLALFLAASFASCSSSSDDFVEEEKGTAPPEVVADNYKFVHRALVEDFTGAWCGYCPLVAHDIEELEKTDADKFQAIAIHNSDKFDFFKKQRPAYEKYMWDKLKVPRDERGYPAAFVNRNIDFRQIGVDPSALVLNTVQKYSPIGIKITSSLVESAGNVSVSLKFGADYKQGVKVAIFILEDGLELRQANYTQLYPPVVNKYSEKFIHNNVLVGMGQEDFFGTLIEGNKTIAEAEVVLEDALIFYKIEKVTNLKVAVVVSDADNNVLNVGVANGNATKDYEVVK